MARDGSAGTACATTPRPRGAFEFAYVAEGDQSDSPGMGARRGLLPDLPRPICAVDLGGQQEGPRRQVGRQANIEDVHGRRPGRHRRSSWTTSRRLGVDALYLTPIFCAPSNHKYDTADYYTVDPDFGGNEAHRRLVAALHARGMRLVLDGVFNHVGATWPQFVDVLNAGDRLALCAAGSTSTAKTTRRGPERAALPKLRTSETAVRDLVCDVGRYWVEQFGVDGWRLDVANEVDHALWRAFRAAVREVRPRGLPRRRDLGRGHALAARRRVRLGHELPVRSAILRYAGGERVAPPLAGGLDGEGFLNAVDRLRAAYPEPIHDLLYNLVGSHDEVRPLTALAGIVALLALAASLLFTLPGVASVYYGDEVGLDGGKDPLNRRAMEWDPARQDQRRCCASYRRLGALRRELPVLRNGGYNG